MNLYGTPLAIFNAMMSGEKFSLAQIQERFNTGGVTRTRDIITLIQTRSAEQGIPIDYVPSVNRYGYFPPNHPLYDEAQTYYMRHWVTRNKKYMMNMEARHKIGRLGTKKFFLVQTRTSDLNTLLEDFETNGLLDNPMPGKSGPLVL